MCAADIAGLIWGLDIARALSRWRAGTTRSAAAGLIVSSAGGGNEEPAEVPLLAEADRLLGGGDAWVISDVTALPKIGRH